MEKKRWAEKNKMKVVKYRKSAKAKKSNAKAQKKWRQGAKTDGARAAIDKEATWRKRTDRKSWKRGRIHAKFYKEWLVKEELDRLDRVEAKQKELDSVKEIAD